MKRDQRFQAILSLLDEQGHVEVDALASHLDVSPETIRRDFADLVTRGILVKMGEKRGSYYLLKK